MAYSYSPGTFGIAGSGSGTPYASVTSSMGALEASLATAADTRWLVAHTKPRCEKKFAALLGRVDTEFYLPTFVSKRKYGNRRERTSDVPVFPGYVFLNLNPDDRPRLFEQGLLVQLIDITHQDAFLRQMESIRRALDSGLLVKPEPILAKGQRARIKSGPLFGLEGTIADPAHPRGIILEVDVLQQGLLINIDPDILELV